jgi:4-amino-4-deoxy-L-arabinose transferase-like glycosyltransferase
MDALRTREFAPALPRLRDGHAVLACIALAAVLLVRLVDLRYNSAFVDEAIYILNGQKALAGTSGFVGVRYMFGSYLYPVLAALFGVLFNDELLGARVLSALCSTAAAGSIYLLTRRLLGALPGLFAMLLFGFASNARLVGQLATYDTLSVGLVAVSAALLVYALTSQRADEADTLGFYAGVAFTLSVLAKYLALLMTPVLALLLLGLLLRRDWQRVRMLLRSFTPPVVVGLTAYGLIFLDDLLRFVQGVNQFASQPAPRTQIVEALEAALLPYAVLALLGAALLLITQRRRWPVALLLLLGAALIPAYHAAASNIRSMDKHIAFSLIALAPLAGYALAAPVNWLLSRRNGTREASLALQAALALALGVGWFALHNRATSDLKLLWPNMTPTVAALRALPIGAGTSILAEGGQTYELYLDWDEDVRLTDTWTQTYTHANLRGDEALLAAVEDAAFDYVVLDSYFTQGLSYRLARVAEDAGYQVIFQDQAPISNGSVITITIYAAPVAAGETDDVQP